MTKDQVVAFLNELTVDDRIMIVCDNLQLFWMNGEDQFVFLDHEASRGLCIRPNIKNGQSGIGQAGNQWEVVTFDYDVIQYMTTFTDAKKALSMLDDLVPAATNIDVTKAKEAIKKSAANRNQIARTFSPNSNEDYGYTSPQVSLEK